MRRRSSAKDRSKSVDGETRPAAQPANKLIEAEKSETGKVTAVLFVPYSHRLHFSCSRLNRKYICITFDLLARGYPSLPLCSTSSIKYVSFPQNPTTAYLTCFYSGVQRVR